MQSSSFWICPKTRFWLLIIFIFLCPYTRRASSDRLSAEEAVIINLSKEAEVSGKRILLGEISEIKCSDQKRLKKLKQLEVSNSPLLGTTIKIDLRKIKWVLRRDDFDLKEFKFGKKPQSVIVKTKSITVTDKRLFDTVKKYLMQNLEGKTEEINLTPARIPDKTELPFGKLKLVPRLPASIRSKNVYIYVDVYIDGERYRTINLSVNLSGTYKVLVAKRNIDRHEKVSLDRDFEEKELILDGIRELSVNPEIFINARTRRFIRKGEFITEDKLELIPQIASGSVITIIAQIHGVTVSAIGKALEDGYTEEKIRVINLRSKKHLEGIVSSKNQVIVKTFAMPY